MALAVDYDRLERDVPAGVPIAIDTSAVIAYLQGGEPASGPAVWLFDGRVAQARNQAFFSAITATEILVAPFRHGDEAVAAVDGFLTFFREISVAPVTLVVARAAAGIRATSGLSLPDSIVLATAVEGGAAVVVTNDRRWVLAAQRLRLPLAICVLGDYVDDARS